MLNHPNGLIDPLVATALLRRRPRFLAKDTLWRNPVLRPFLPLFDPIPVRRRSDGPADRESLRRTFAAVHAAFAAGHAVAIFPEGVSQEGARLAPLKTGAARMVLSSPVPVTLVPAGLVYGNREVFRHSVLVRVGAPISHEDLRERGPEPEAVHALTARIRDALYPLTLQHEGEPVVRALAEDLAWLLAEGPAERTDLLLLQARVRALLPRVEALAPGERSRLGRRVRAVRRWLRRRGIRPDQVGHRYAREQVLRWPARLGAHLALFLATLPAGLLFWPAYRAVGWAAGRAADTEDMTGTYKLVGGVVLLPLWGGLLAWALGWLPALAAAVLAFLTLPLAERLREDLQAFRGWRASRGGPVVERLVRWRQGLLEAFPELQEGRA